MFVMFLILTVGLGILEIILRSADRVSEIARRFAVRSYSEPFYYLTGKGRSHAAMRVIGWRKIDHFLSNQSEGRLKVK